MKYVAYAALAIIALASVVLVVTLSSPKLQEEPDPPCDELIWMRDSPQARCVEYWKQQDLKEQNELLDT